MLCCVILYFNRIDQRVHRYREYIMEPTWRLRRIGIISAMKTAAVVAAALGFILGTFWGFMLAFFSSVISTAFDIPMPGASAVFVIALPVIAALFYCVLGTLLTFLVGILYNLAAGVTGGVEFDFGFERKQDTGAFI